jgi:hypothetical protein
MQRIMEQPPLPQAVRGFLLDHFTSYGSIDTVGHKLTRKIAWLLPHRLVYWCGLRLWANATTGEYSNELAPGMTIDTILDRWQK